MVARAVCRYIRISPFKVRMVLPLIKGKPALLSLDILSNINKRGAYYLHKVLKSAVANAKNKGFDEKSLFISSVVVNPGPILKRYRAATFGRATMIRKRTSHIIIELDSSEKLDVKQG